MPTSNPGPYPLPNFVLNASRAVEDELSATDDPVLERDARRTGRRLQDTHLRRT